MSTNIPGTPGGPPPTSVPTTNSTPKPTPATNASNKKFVKSSTMKLQAFQKSPNTPAPASTTTTTSSTSHPPPATPLSAVHAAPVTAPVTAPVVPVTASVIAPAPSTNLKVKAGKISGTKFLLFKDTGANQKVVDAFTKIVLDNIEPNSNAEIYDAYSDPKVATSIKDPLIQLVKGTKAFFLTSSADDSFKTGKPYSDAESKFKDPSDLKIVRTKGFAPEDRISAALVDTNDFLKNHQLPFIYETRKDLSGQDVILPFVKDNIGSKPVAGFLHK
jgi:hypothetical protein